MANINSLLSLGNVSMVTQHERNILCVSNNIANVDTPFYSRQTLNIVERDALNLAPGQMGQGAWTKECVILTTL